MTHYSEAEEKQEFQNKVKWIYRIEEFFCLAILIVSGYLTWGLRPGGVMFAETVYTCMGIVFMSAIGVQACKFAPVFMSRKWKEEHRQDDNEDEEETEDE